jgi:predicted Zn-dependent protease
MVSNVSVLVLYGDSSDPEHQKRVSARLEEAVRKHRDRLSIQFDLANLRSLQGRYAEAEAIFKVIAEQAKDTGAPLNNLAWMLAMQGGKEGKALALVDRAAAIDGLTPDVLDTRALILLAMGKGDAAARDLEDAVAVSPAADKYFHLARAYWVSGKRTDARQALKKADEMGLVVGGLHPLEQGTYRRLIGDMARR